MAINLYRRAVEDFDYKKARYNFALCLKELTEELLKDVHQSGKTILVYRKESRRWFQRIIEDEQGNDTSPTSHYTKSAYQLGQMYKNGLIWKTQQGDEVVIEDVDEVEAVKWFTISANHGYGNAMYELGLLFLQKDRPSEVMVTDGGEGESKTPSTKFPSLSKLLSTNRLYCDTKTALEWFTKAVACDKKIFTNPQRQDAEFYILILRDPYESEKKQVIEKLRHYAQKGNIQAQCKIGDLLKGSLQKEDYQECLKWLHEAADKHKSTDAMMLLGLQYAPYAQNAAYRNTEKSAYYFNECIKYGNMSGKFGLSSLIGDAFSGDGNEIQQILQLIMEAASEGDCAEAWQRLSTLSIYDEPLYRHPYLLKTWDVEPLMILETILESNRGKRNNKFSPSNLQGLDYCDYSTFACHQYGRCILCRCNRMLYLQPAFHQSATSRIVENKTHIPNPCFVESLEEIVKKFEKRSNLLGAGGFGKVMEATLIVNRQEEGDTETKQVHIPVALKKLVDKPNRNGYSSTLHQHSSTSSPLDATTTKLQMIQEEFTKLKLFQNKNQYITTCYGHTSLNNDYFLVMELSPYGDLVDVISVIASSRDETSNSNHDNTSSLLPPALLVHWMHDIAQGLKAIHHFHLMHLDIKPHNILVFKNMKCKLADLGLTRKEAFDDSDQILPCDIAGEQGQASTTIVGVGTPGFMAPELLECPPKLPTTASDMFSFGMTCVYMVNQGYVPGISPQSWQLLLNHALQLLENQSLAGYSEIRDLIINFCADSKHRKERYTSADAVQRLQHVRGYVIDRNGTEEMLQNFESLFSS